MKEVATELLGMIADLPDGRVGEIVNVWVNKNDETMVTLKLRADKKIDRHQLVEIRTIELLLHPSIGWY